MASYDSDITLSVELQPGDVKSTAESLRKDVEQILGSTSGKEVSSSFKSLQNNMEKSHKKAGELLQRMKELENTSVPTKEYAELEKQYEKLLGQLGSLSERKERFLETGGRTGSKTFQRMQYDFDKINERINEIRQQMEQLRQEGGAAVLGEDTQEYANITSQLNEVNNQMRVYAQRANEISSTKSSPNTDGWKTFSSVVSKSISILKMIPAGIQRVISVLGRMGAVAVRAGMQVVNALANLGKQALKAAAQVGKLVLNLGKLAGQAAIRGLSSLVKRVGSLGSALKKTNKSGRASNDIFKKGFMTFLRYGLGIRSIYFLFRRLRKALGEGIGNLAQYSPSFNNVISNFISALTRLKNTFATAFAPIINVVGPILTTFINLVSEAVTRIGMLIAALTGQRTFIRAKAVQEDYAASLDNAAGSAGNATKAAKEYQKTIAGFDDVEILKNPDRDSSSGGGSGGSGGGGGISPQDMFETVDIPTGLEDLAERIKQAWLDSNFTAIGEMLGEKLGDALNSIPWDKVQKTANKFGQSFATLINGFVEVEGLGNTIGQTIGEAINTGLSLWEGFVDKLHFDSIGAFIAEGMNGLVITVDWTKLANNIIKTANGIFTLANTWADKFNFKALGTELGSTISSVFTNLDFDKMRSAFSKIGSGLASALDTFFAERPLTAVGTALGKALNAVLTGTNSFINDLPTKTIGEDLAGAMNGIFTNEELWKNIANALSGAANSVFSLTATWSGKFNFAALGSSIRTTITDTLNNLQWNDAKTAVKNIATGIATALNNVMTANTFQAVGTAIAEGINTALTGVNNFVSGIQWDDWGINLAAGINSFFRDLDWNTINVTFNNISRSLGKAINGAVTAGNTFIGNISWTNWATTLSAGINTFFATVKWEDLGVTFNNAARSIGNAINAAITVGYTFIKNIEWDEWGKTVGNGINTFFRTVSWGDIGVTFTGIVSGLLRGLTEAIETINFKDVGHDVAVALANVDWGKLFDEAAKLLKVTVEAWEDFVAALFTNLNEAIIQWVSKNLSPTAGDIVRILLGETDEQREARQYQKEYEKYMEEVGYRPLTQEDYEEIKRRAKANSNGPSDKSTSTRVPVVLEATLLEDNIPDEDKKIDNIRANAEKVVDKIEPAKKLFENFKAKFSKTDTTGIPEKERTVGEITAELMTFEDNIPESDKNVGEVTAEIMNFEDELPANQKYIRDMNGNITGIIETITPTKKVIKDLEGNVVKIVDDVPKTLKVLSDGQLKLKRMDSTGLPESEKKVTNGSVVVSTVDKKSLPNSEKVVTGGSLSTSTLDKSKLTAAQKTVTGVTATVGAFNESKNAIGKTTTGYSATVSTYTEGSKASGKSASGFTGVIDTYKEAYNKGKGVDKTASGFTATISEYSETDKTGGKKPTDFTATITKYREPVDNKTKVKGKTQSGFTGELTKYSENKPSGKKQSGFEGQVTKYSESKPSGKNPSGFTAGVTSFDDDIASKKKTVSGFTADFSYVTGLQDRVKSILRGLGLMKAEGGAFYGGSWHAIAQYATGGRPRYGTHFVAGEAGPEVVGHIGGRTEVLNQSQLAATMYSAVVNGSAKAIGAILNHMTNCVNSLNTNIGSIININVSEFTLLQKIDSALNNIDTNLTAIVTGKMIPNTVSASTTNELIATLRTMANVLQSNQENTVSRDDLTTILTTMFRQYMNISFYMGDEEVARHANNGNARLGYRFDPVVR